LVVPVDPVDPEATLAALSLWPKQPMRCDGLAVVFALIGRGAVLMAGLETAAIDDFLGSARAVLAANGCLPASSQPSRVAADPPTVDRPSADSPATFFLSLWLDGDRDALEALFGPLAPHFSAFQVVATATRPLAADWSSALWARAKRTQGDDGGGGSVCDWWAQGAARPLPCDRSGGAWDGGAERPSGFAPAWGLPMVESSMFALGCPAFDEYRDAVGPFFSAAQRRAWRADAQGGDLSLAVPGLGAYRDEPINFHYSRHVEAKFLYTTAATAVHCGRDSGNPPALRLLYPDSALVHFA
jgi:hypothetical protein